MGISSSRFRGTAVVALAVIAAVALQKAPEYAWGSVTVDGQRYKVNSSSVHAIVPPGEAPPAFMGCRWTAPQDESQVCRHVAGNTGSAWIIGFSPLLISLALGLSMLGGMAALVGLARPVALRPARHILGVAACTALVAMVIPFLTVRHAVAALHEGTVFFGARGTDYMLIAIVAAAIGSELASALRNPRSPYIARSTAATVAAV